MSRVQSLRDHLRPAGGAPTAVPAPAERRTRHGDHQFWAAVVVSIVPLVYDASRAINEGWLAQRDDAFLVLWIHDVFTRHSPLTGVPLGGVGFKAYELGPLEYWLLGVPYRIAGTTAGIVVGAAVVAVASVVAIGVVARRLGGPVFGIATLLVTTWLVRSIGVGVAHSPYNPAIVLLPFLLLILMTVALTLGEPLLLPGIAFVASFVVQTHISFGAVTAIIVVWSTAFGVLGRRRVLRAGHGRTVRRITLLTVVVLAFSWSAPVLQAFVGPKWNLVEAPRSVAHMRGTRTGGSVAVGLAAKVAASPPPVGLRLHAFGERLVGSHHLQVGSLAQLTAVFAFAGGLGVVALRRGRRRVALVLVLAVLLLAVATVTVSRAPLNPGFGPVVGVLYAQVLWPVAAAFWIVVLLALVKMFPPPGRASLAVGAVMVALLIPMAIVATARRDPMGGGGLGTIRVHDFAIKTGLLRQITSRLADSLPRRGTYRLVLGSHPTGIEPGVVADLEDRGYRFLVDTTDPGMVRLYRYDRHDRGQRVIGTVYVVPSNRATTLIPKGEPVPRILLRTGADDARELDRLSQTLRQEIARGGGLRFDAKTERLLHAISAPELAALAPGFLAALNRDGHVVGPRLSQRLLDRRARLAQLTAPQYRFDVAYAPAR